MRSNYGDSNAEVKTKSFTLALSTANQEIVTAVTGKKLRFMGYSAQTTGAANANIAIKDGTGGTTYEFIYAPQSTANPYTLPVIDEGYWSTTVSTGIFGDNNTATSCVVIVRYIEYIP